jgi:alpha-glucosidase
MPYWALGFHQCRFGYKSVEEVAAVVANYSAANIPLETMWTDIDYMDSYKVYVVLQSGSKSRWPLTTSSRFILGKYFPLDEMRDLVSGLHAKNQHYIVMVDPGKICYRSLRR